MQKFKRILFGLVFIPLLTLAQQPQETLGITPDSVNLTAGRFFVSYMSDDASERYKSEIYLLGVMDSSENQTWCDYKKFKTITLRERIFEDFKKLSGDQLNQRASTVINQSLSRRYPCRNKK